MVCLPNLESQLCVAVGSSAAGVALECPTDLGYRGILPRGLGRVLDSTQAELDPAYVPPTADDEEYATFRQPTSIIAESATRERVLQTKRASIWVASVLLLGIRLMRASFAKRIAAWRPLAAHAHGPSDQAAQTVIPAPSVVAGQRASVAGRFAEWRQSRAGKSEIQELQWRVLPLSAVLARVSRALHCLPGQSTAVLRHFVETLGIPFAEDGDIVWDRNGVTLSAMRILLTEPCMCPYSQAQRVMVWRIGA